MRKFLSAPYWIHLAVESIIGQGIWWILSQIIGTTIIIRSIIAGIILIATIFAVAWYLPKISPSGAKSEDRKNKETALTPTVPTVEFYESKKQLVDIYGGLDKEISISKKMWLSFWLGSFIEDKDTLKSKNITKLALFDPEYEALQIYADLMQKDIDTVQKIILRNTETAIIEGIKVWWVKRPMDSIVVCNPEERDNTGRVRIESLPYNTNDQSLNIVIYEKERKELFTRMLKYFNQLMPDGQDIVSRKINVDDVRKRIESRKHKT